MNDYFFQYQQHQMRPGASATPLFENGPLAKLVLGTDTPASLTAGTTDDAQTGVLGSTMDYKTAMLALAIASPAAPVVPASSGDPLTNDDGYLGGAITTPPDEQRGPASWIQFAGMGLVTGAKYTTAGIETGLDWITGGLGPLQGARSIAFGEV